MALRVKIQEITFETEKKGRNQWQKATVNYLWQGEARQQTIMSFSNPDVFKTLQNLAPGSEVEIEITKNDKGYNQWSRIQMAGEQAAPKAAMAAADKPAGKVLGSNYETAEERKMRQLYIIKQSSIANALTYHEKDDVRPSVQDVLATAQVFVDFVYGAQDFLAQDLAALDAA